MLKSRVEILKYLDDSIEYWRQDKFSDISVYYIDAFLSAKEAIFGKGRDDNYKTWNPRYRKNNGKT